MRGRLLRVSWQDQSDKIQSITVQWQTQSPAEPGAEPLAVVEELCMESDDRVSEEMFRDRKSTRLNSSH